MGGLSGEARVWLFIAVIGAAVGALYLGVIVELDGLRAPFHLSLPALAALFFLSEVAIVHLQVDRNAQHITLAELPVVLGLYFASPQDLVTAHVLGAFLALHFYRRQHVIKLAFNLASYALQSCVSVIVFQALIRPEAALSPTGWAATFAATLTASVISLPLVFMAIAQSERRMVPRIPVFGFAFALMATVANTSMMVLGVTVIWTEPVRLLLLAVPTAILFVSYRAYMSQRERNESLQFLHEATRSVQRSVEMDAAILTLGEHARTMFRAEIAQVTLFSEDDPTLGYRTSVGGDSQPKVMEEVRLDPKEGVWARVAAEAKAVLIPRPIENDRLRIHFASRGIFKDAMVAPLLGRDAVVGTVLIGDRLGDIGTFDEEDLKLFETLATHASTALENARLIDRLKESLAHLTEMNRLKDDFVATVSHELRTPLTSIQGYIKTLLRPDADRLSSEDQKAFLEAAERSSERLRSLIEDLLMVAKLEADESESVRTDVDLREVIHEVIGDLRLGLDDRPVEAHVDEDVKAFETDRGRVGQILSNLIENAAKYSVPGGAIGVEARREGDGVTVSVTDAGPGIPAGERERIFERFYQVDQSHTRTVGGTGLGLYLCREMARSLGGRVWLEASGPEGSRFDLWLPDPVRPATAGPGSSAADPTPQIEIT